MAEKGVDEYVREVASAIVERDLVPMLERMRPVLGDKWVDEQIAFARRYARF